LRHATRAALLLDGAIVRTWNSEALAAMNHDARIVEDALAQATRERLAVQAAHKK
jgi:hypothetical protein